MGKLLGFGLYDYPAMTMPDSKMARPLQGALQSDRTPASLRDESNWPQEIREEWGSDQGAATAKAARDYSIEQFKKVRSAIDSFEPDAIVILSKDHCETVQRSDMFLPYWICAYDSVTIKPYQEGNMFDAPVDTTATIDGARDFALELARGLREQGISPVVQNSPSSPAGIASAFRASLLFLDWEQRLESFPYKVLPIPFNPFGDRARDATGVEPLNDKHWLPATMPAGWELGEAIAKVVLASDKKIALGVSVGWSHANNTSWEKNWICPDIAADRALFNDWKANKFDRLRNISADELEEHGWWELWGWAVLAGAMSEAGAKLAHADLQDHWIFNSTWITSIFEESGK